mgnify:CR=1 FL=1
MKNKNGTEHKLTLMTHVHIIVVVRIIEQNNLLIIFFQEKGIFFIGLEKDKAGVDPPNVWTFSSEQKK